MRKLGKDKESELVCPSPKPDKKKKKKNDCSTYSSVTPRKLFSFSFPL